MARCWPRDKAPMTRSDGREDSGTRVMLPVHLHQGGSAQFSWSAFQSWNRRDLSGVGGGWSTKWVDCASTQSLARLKSFPYGPSQLHAKMHGSACISFLLSLTGRGRTKTKMLGWRKQCILIANVKCVACGRYLCFVRENSVW